MKAKILLMSKALINWLSKTKQTITVMMVSLLLVSTTTIASPISSLYVFGDSLSDSGAFTHLNPAFCPPVPYSECRFTNGSVWVEVLANNLGLTADSAYNGGTNYAIAGQASADVLNGQIPAYMGLSGGVADADALYVIWAGGNDYVQNLDPIAAVNNIIDSIITLSLVGANNFLIPNLPAVDLWAATFNTSLASGLDSLSNGLNITQLDVLGLFIDITINPSQYGFTNISDPCFDGVTLCANPDQYLLWDTNHTTAAGHRAIAAAALMALQVSAPATFTIFSLGLAVLWCSRRKKGIKGGITK
jgi:phospholipase/lecithinase/hemolysin